MITSYYSRDELAAIGFKSFGTDVNISRKASFYGVENIVIGSHVRIDDFCILSGNISIGNYVHINPYCGVFAGSAGVTFEDYVNISSNVIIYAISDDYSGRTMTSPLIPEEYKNVRRAPVWIKKLTIVGTGSTILPGVVIGEGCAIGAMSLVKNDLPEWGIYCGIPCKYLKDRSNELLSLVHDEY